MTQTTMKDVSTTLSTYIVHNFFVGWAVFVDHVFLFVSILSAWTQNSCPPYENTGKKNRCTAPV